jgi:DNA-binding NtrC family response regulator
MSTVRREPGPAVRSRVNALLIDDGETYEAALRDHLPELTLVGPRQPDGLAALAFLSQNDHADRTDLVLLDVHFDVPESRLLPLGEGATLRQTRRAQGVAILRELRARWPHLPVVLLTSADELPFDALRAELAAAPSTFMLGGDDLDALRIRVHEALAARRLAREEDGVFWGRDAGMVAARRRLAVLARGRMPVILEGETGTGKSYIAERWIHAQSGRPGPFIAADLSTLPPDLVPAYLFGAQRGAYTGAVADRKGVFELAGGGTLFLDEVQNLSAETQRQLLLVLQDRRVRPLGASRDVPVDVKVIAASNQSLAGAVAAGRFRADLYMRLGPATRVVLPPLRHRRGDLAELVRTFVEGSTDDPDVAALRDQVGAGLGLPPGAAVRLVASRGPREPGGNVLGVVLPPPAWQALQAHPWPGNVRELATVLHNVVVFTLVAAADALAAGVSLRAPRLQVDPRLVDELLRGSLPPAADPSTAASSVARPEPEPVFDAPPPPMAPTAAPASAPPVSPPRPDEVAVRLAPADTLNAVAQAVERQYFTHLFRETGGDFARMAERLLGDPVKARAIRLRFNQLGLSARALRGP